MKEENNKKDNKIKNKLLKNKTIITIILFVIFIYILYTVYLLIKDPTDTFTVEEGVVSEEESVIRVCNKR